MSSNEEEYGTNWREKYLEVADMLAETRAELDDFQHSSKELEEELERELERTERAQEELKNKIARAEHEREDWKTRFMSLQTQHNTTTTSLQRELDQLRQIHHQLKSQMRELEIGNDDLEGRERAVTSSLADLESRYSKVLEEKILLEQELLDKASLEEECQRLKDDKRDINEEVDVLREQIADAKAQLAAHSAASLSHVSSHASSSGDELVHTVVPNMLMDEIEDETATSTSSSSATTASTALSLPTQSETTAASQGQAAILKRAGFGKSQIGSPALSRSTTMPSMSPSPSRLPMTRTPRMQTTTAVPTRGNLSTSVTSTAARSKGVQMVSEMRTRVKALEQKIHSRVPRLRMGSVTGRAQTGSSDSLSKDGVKSRRTEKENEPERSGAESPGWVLIMEESTPQAPRTHKRSADSGGSRSSTEQPRASSPSDGPSAFRAQTQFSKSSSAAAPSSSASASGLRRPASRLSASTDNRSSIGSSVSATSSVSTISSSRPATPTFLPVPTTSLRTSATSTSGRRSSLGPSAALTTPSPAPPTSSSRRERPQSIPMGGKPFANGSSLDKSQIGAPRIPRSHTKDLPELPTSLSTSSGLAVPSLNPLSSSRIGRPAPSAYVGTRRSQDDSDTGTQSTSTNGTSSGSTMKLSRFRSGSFRS